MNPTNNNNAFRSAKVSRHYCRLFDYSNFVPDEAYAWISVQHIAQALIFMGIIFGVKRFKPLPYGLG